MECHSVFSPCTSRNANLRRKREKPYSRMSDNDGEHINVLVSGVQDPVVTNTSRQTVVGYHRREAAHAYVSEVARRYAEKIRKMKERSLHTDFESESTSLPVIKQRLRRLTGECDIERTTCCIPMCGRVFTSVQVLAWHMSYSHHDLAQQSAYGNLCFVCGIRMESAKGKTIHLMSKHKDLSIAHNEQCVYQRMPVISPLAPAAMRLSQFTDDRVADEDLYEEVEYNGYNTNTSNEHIIDGESVQLATDS